MTTTQKVDRAALVRRALVELVAQRGFRGTSMAAVAEQAGVATGTAYVHYSSKDDLVLAAYTEVKAALGAAAGGAISLDDPPPVRFRSMWLRIRDHLVSDPVRARFLVQVDASPYSAAAHAAAVSDDENQLMKAVGADLRELFAELPGLVLYDLGIGPIVRIVARGESLSRREWDRLAEACWRAVTRS